MINEVDDKGPELTLKKEYDKQKNIVKVTVTSNKKLKPKTLAGWVLRS